MPSFQLRPLDFGEILDRAFTVYRQHFLTLFLTALIPFIPISLGSALLVTDAMLMNPNQPPDEVFLWLLPLALVSGVGAILAWAALTRQFSRALTGGTVTLGDGYARAARAFFPLLGAGILAYIAILVLVMGFGIAMAIVGGVIGAALGPMAGAVISLLVGVAILVVFLTVFAGCFAVPAAVVVEKKGPLTALGRSWELARGALPRAAGVVLVGWLLTFLPMIGVILIFGMGPALFNPEAPPGGTAIFLQQVASLAAFSLTLPLFVGCLVALYYDRRVRVEGYDLQLAADELALTP
jgi:hypothetical protein